MPLDLRIEVKGRMVTLRLGLLEVGKLRPHEEITYSNYIELYDRILGSGIFVSPITVDEASRVVLDGTHRLAVAKSLGLKSVPAVLVDYGSSEVGLQVWAKLFRGDVDKAVAALSQAGLKAVGEGWRGPIGCSLISEDYTISFAGQAQGSGEGFSAFRMASKLLVKLFGEPAAVADARPRRGEFALIPPPISKRDVVEAGLKGELFPAKTTRHKFSARIVEAPIPVGLLKVENAVKADRELEAVLSKKNVRVVEGKTVYGGRLYDDDKLVVFG